MVRSNATSPLANAFQSAAHRHVAVSMPEDAQCRARLIDFPGYPHWHAPPRLPIPPHEQVFPYPIITGTLAYIFLGERVALDLCTPELWRGKLYAHAACKLTPFAPPHGSSVSAVVRTNEWE